MEGPPSLSQWPEASFRNTEASGQPLPPPLWKVFRAMVSGCAGSMYNPQALLMAIDTELSSLPWMCQWPSSHLVTEKFPILFLHQIKYFFKKDLFRIFCCTSFVGWSRMILIISSGSGEKMFSLFTFSSHLRHGFVCLYHISTQLYVFSKLSSSQCFYLVS